METPIQNAAASRLLPPLRRAVTSIGRSVVDLLFPPGCAACDGPMDEDGVNFCAACARKLMAQIDDAYCRVCAGAGPLDGDGRCRSCENRLPPYERIVRVGPYDDTLRDTVLRFKYGHGPALQRPLGRLMHAAVGGAIDISAIDVWTPVPAHWQKRLNRRYVPTHLLASQLARLTGRPWTQLLRVTRLVHEQKRLPASQREANVRGGFRPISSTTLEGMTIGLVDDIFTTGATMREAARVLRGAEALRIYAVVVATAAPGMDAVLP